MNISNIETFGYPVLMLPRPSPPSKREPSFEQFHRKQELERRKFEMEAGKKARALEAQRTRRRLENEATARAAKAKREDEALQARIKASITSGVASSEEPVRGEETAAAPFKGRSALPSETTFPKEKHLPNNPFVDAHADTILVELSDEDRAA